MKKIYMVFTAILLLTISACSNSIAPKPAPLSAEKAIIAYSLAGTVGTINEDSKTIAVAKPLGTDLTALVATYTTTGASVKVGAITKVSGTTQNNFTAPVTYTVTAADNSISKYTINVFSPNPFTMEAKPFKLGHEENLQKGTAGSQPRFKDNGDQTITDNLTGLIWTQNGNAPGPAGCSPKVDKTWQQALDYVTCLNTNNYLEHNDWRLPNSEELSSLINNSEANTADWLNTQGFNHIQTDWYWAMHKYTYAHNTAVAWMINLKDGYVSGNNKNNYNYVWPVRTKK